MLLIRWTVYVIKLFMLKEEFFVFGKKKVYAI